MREGLREAGRFGARVARRHGPMSTTLDALIAGDFVIRHVEAWRPADAQIAAGPPPGWPSSSSGRCSCRPPPTEGHECCVSRASASRPAASHRLGSVVSR
jgi:hypothetical protein